MSTRIDMEKIVTDAIVHEERPRNFRQRVARELYRQDHVVDVEEREQGILLARMARKDEEGEAVILEEGSDDSDTNGNTDGNTVANGGTNGESSGNNDGDSADDTDDHSWAKDVLRSLGYNWHICACLVLALVRLVIHPAVSLLVFNIILNYFYVVLFILVACLIIITICLAFFFFKKATPVNKY